MFIISRQAVSRVTCPSLHSAGSLLPVTQRTTPAGELNIWGKSSNYPTTLHNSEKDRNISQDRVEFLLSRFARMSYNKIDTGLFPQIDLWFSIRSFLLSKQNKIYIEYNANEKKNIIRHFFFFSKLDKNKIKFRHHNIKMYHLNNYNYYLKKIKEWNTLQ